MGAFSHRSKIPSSLGIAKWALFLIAAISIDLHGLVEAYIASARNSVIIAVDLSHGQLSAGLDSLVASCPKCRWVLIMPQGWEGLYYYSYPSLYSYIEGIRSRYYVEIRIGGFTRENLRGVDVIIIPSISSHLAKPEWAVWAERGGDTPEELLILTSWFREGGKILWVGASNDEVIRYPLIQRVFGNQCFSSERSFSNRISQLFANSILIAIGSMVRIDYSSIYTRSSHAEGMVASRLGSLGGFRVALPAAGPLYIMLPNNTIANPIETTTQRIEVVVVANASISTVDPAYHRSFGAHGLYKPGEIRAYPAMVIENKSTGIVIVSGDTMVGGMLWAFQTGCRLELIEGGLYVNRWPPGTENQTEYSGSLLVRRTIEYIVKSIAGDVADRLLEPLVTITGIKTIDTVAGQTTRIEQRITATLTSYITTPQDRVGSREFFPSWLLIGVLAIFVLLVAIISISRR